MLIVGILIFCCSTYIIYKPSYLAQNDFSQSFPIIMYHHISEIVGQKGEYVITPEDFENDLKYLKDRGYKSLTMRELYAIDKGEKTLSPKSIMITFDDGQESFYKYAYPLLKKYGFSAVLSFIGKYTEEYSKMKDRDVAYSHVTWDELKEMTQSGIVELGNHSYNMHSNNGEGRVGVTPLPYESESDYKISIEKDINKFNDLLENNLGFKPQIYTYPFGRFTNLTVEIIKENGFIATFTCYEKRVIPNLTKDWLYNLGRYNRSGTKTTEYFFKSISVR